MQYRTMRRVVPALGGAYVVLGLLATMAPGFEVFPFFCWFLFPVTPNVETRYELVIDEIGGCPLAQPTEYQSMDLVEDPMAMDLWIAVQALGRAEAAGDAPSVQTLRRRIELNFIPAPNRYRLDRVTFDPVERWRDGGIRSRDTVTTYTSSVGAKRIPWTYAP